MKLFIAECLIWVLSIALHELAHVLAAEWCGLTVLEVVWRWRPFPGVGVRHTQGSQGCNFLVAAAGPAMSLFLFWALWPFSPVMAINNLMFALLCLAPMSNSDGARMLRAWENMRAGYEPYTRRG